MKNTGIVNQVVVCDILWVCQGYLDSGKSEYENKELTKGWKRVSVKSKQLMNTGNIHWCGTSTEEPKILQQLNKQMKSQMLVQME